MLLIREGGSTSEHHDGLCAVVSFSHEHLGATASDLGSVGECANERSLSVHWCQDGKCATSGFKLLAVRRGDVLLRLEVSRRFGVRVTTMSVSQFLRLSCAGFRCVWRWVRFKLAQDGRQSWEESLCIVRYKLDCGRVCFPMSPHLWTWTTVFFEVLMTLIRRQLLSAFCRDVNLLVTARIMENVFLNSVYQWIVLCI